MPSFQILDPATTLKWDDFYKGTTSSDEIKFRDDDMMLGISFQVEEFLSDETDFFGVNVPKFRLLAYTSSCRVEDGEEGLRTVWDMGSDFCELDDARTYAQYVLWCYRTTHGSLRYCPVAEICDD